MTGPVQAPAGRRVHVCPAEGDSLADERNLSGLMGELFGSGATLVAIPLARLGPDFLRLSSGVAGAVLQKLVNYRFQVAILGDISAAVAASDPLRDFVRESNRGTTVWFVADLAALDAKLANVAYGRA
ncbi:MAG: DUF4180 domain-containing protein [Caulobacterales bacterium]|jgi:hypothetical protein